MKKRKAACFLALFILLAGVCLTVGSAEEPKTVRFVFLLNEEAILDCSAGESLLDRYLETVSAEDSPCLFFDADAITYGTDFVSALYKLYLNGYPIGAMARSSGTAALFGDYVKNLLKVGAPLILSETKETVSDDRFSGILCAGRANSFTAFQQFVSQKRSGCLAVRLSGNEETVQTILNYCSRNGLAAADYYDLLAAAEEN
ncbi:MAG: hypothetical protein KBS76_04360 [Ruminococcus sp.]|nr:hypothetical protein [Candidatus Apopatosoma intestinale]